VLSGYPKYLVPILENVNCQDSTPPGKQEEIMRLRLALGSLPCTVDVWVMSEEEFEETKDVIGGLAYPANKYGLVLHEKS